MRRIAGHAGDRRDAVADLGADEAEPELAFLVRVRYLRGGGGEARDRRERSETELQLSCSHHGHPLGRP